MSDPFLFACTDTVVFVYIQQKKRGLVKTNPQQVLGTGVEPVRALLPTGF